jgi:chemotaxis protein CheD
MNGPMDGSRFATVPKPDALPGHEHVRRGWDGRLGRWSAKILPGEYYVTRHDEAITTVLGSCISACIRDPVLGAGGMNHFMLPEEAGNSNWGDAGTHSTRYGSAAMERLVNDLLKAGARRERLEVKLFGGGRILASNTQVGARNIDFAHEWLGAEGFTVVREDVGGNVPRRVIYFPATGRALVKHLMQVESRLVADRERHYLDRVKHETGGDDIELF